jgi:hypothetical protein
MSTDLDAALASTKLFKQQLEDALAGRYNANKGEKPMTTPMNDDAISDIEAPFTLNADAIVERVDKETGATVYEVEKAGKVIYSTITRPLAFAFLAGVNANPGKAAKAAAPKTEGDDGPKAAPETASIEDDAPKPSGAQPAAKDAPRKRSVL